MSVAKRFAEGEKVVLPRQPEKLWETIEREWAGDSKVAWRYLAILHLYVHCHWTTEMLGHAFGHSKGHISRIIRLTKGYLASRFERPPDDDKRGSRVDG